MSSSISLTGLLPPVPSGVEALCSHEAGVSRRGGGKSKDGDERYAADVGPVWGGTNCFQTGDALSFSSIAQATASFISVGIMYQAGSVRIICNRTSATAHLSPFFFGPLSLHALNSDVTQHRPLSSPHTQASKHNMSERGVKAH